MAKEYKLGILPYFPLASGLLTGKYKRGSDAPAGTRFALVPRLRDRYVNDKNIGIVEKLRRVRFARAVTPCSNSRSRGSRRARKSPA